jgi:nicotinate-nucleotide adenylyltransferase
MNFENQLSAVKSEKIGIFGGSFNPIHNGHLNVIRTAKELCGLDKIYVIPANISPLKNVKDYVSPEHRVNMCKLATQDIPYVEVSDTEIKRQGVSYTFDTLQDFKGNEIYLLIGSDSFLEFNKWYKYQEILKLCKLVVVSRNKSDNFAVEKAKTLYEKGQVLVLNAEILEMSSSLIRNTKKFACFLSKEVVEYIVDNGLYRSNEN